MILFIHKFLLCLTPLFAVSGFHLSLWTAMIFTFTEHLRGRMRLFGNLGALLFVIFFMALTGFTPSVMRAGAMMLIFILSKIINQQADSLNSLCLALTVLLLTNPFLASSISLQLSFFATLGIISFASPLNELSIRLKRKIKPKIIFNAVEREDERLRQRFGRELIYDFMQQRISRTADSCIIRI